MNAAQPARDVVTDLQALLGGARVAGTHNVDPSVDLVGSGILTFVSVF